MASSVHVSALERLQVWYLSNCNGDWEHQYGMRLETLDNPGWSLNIDLEDTNLENQDFAGISVGDSNILGWLQLKKEGSKLLGTCGPTKLTAMLDIAANWLHSHEA